MDFQISPLTGKDNSAMESHGMFLVALLGMLLI